MIFQESTRTRGPPPTIDFRPEITCIGFHNSISLTGVFYFPNGFLKTHLPQLPTLRKKWSVGCMHDCASSHYTVEYFDSFLNMKKKLPLPFALKLFFHPFLWSSIWAGKLDVVPKLRIKSLKSIAFCDVIHLKLTYLFDHLSIISLV